MEKESMYEQNSLLKKLWKDSTCNRTCSEKKTSFKLCWYGFYQCIHKSFLYIQRIVSFHRPISKLSYFYSFEQVLCFKESLPSSVEHVLLRHKRSGHNPLSKFSCIPVIDHAQNNAGIVIPRRVMQEKEMNTIKIWLCNWNVHHRPRFEPSDEGKLWRSMPWSSDEPTHWLICGQVSLLIIIQVHLLYT